MATYTKYETFIENLANKLIDAFGTTDTWKAVIHTDAPVVATDNVLGDLTQIGGSNGYTTGGSDITYNSTRTGATITATAVDVVWTASGGNLGASTTGRYVSIYDDTSALDNLLCSYDYGATFTVATGETFTLDFGASFFTLA
ncbi:hypothetical protein [Mesorhizobium sp. B2-1-2]|uniref:hypothetical protein n=1 Tax=Mesorhizobium sp. B2-1-2 TaxID=2589973 RepID=UPI00112769B4|nr:hypothetical protein [Mesorhizobium sp. B2-1-2]TPN11712.1 hypothetical protein FJ971_09910 [Mesorhizobium sp. B2-1-2]